MNNSRRVFLNTSIQYLRSLISILITLYTSRVVLSNLGANDFGIYSLVGGVISMFAFIQTNLANTIVRFLSYYRGGNNEKRIYDVFNNSVTILVVMALLLTFSLFFLTDLVFDSVLNIDSSSMQKAKIVYWIMLLSLFFNLLSIPYLANIISHENIVYSSIVQILDAFLKIPIAVSLIYISSNKLEWYSIWTCFIIVLNFILYFIYCFCRYKECRRYSIRGFDLKLFREMFSFMGWSSYGTLCVVARTQGIAILLNRFYTTSINAAYGIAFQVSSQLGFLSSSLVNAINPQIIKAEGSGDRQRMFRLSEISCKFSFLLMSIVSIPSYCYMPELLELWLKDVPDYTVMFCRYVLLAAQIDLLSSNMATASQAIGNVKMYNITQQTLKVLTLPFVYLLLKCGYGAESVMIVFVFFESLCVISRVIFLRVSVRLSIASYLRNVFLDVMPSFLVVFYICFSLSRVLLGYYLFLNYLISAFLIVLITACFGLRADEKRILSDMVVRFRRKK